MNLHDCRLLLDYHYWARDRLIEAVTLLTPQQYTRDLGNSFRSVRDTLTHIYFAEWAWHQRWIGQSPTKALEPDMFPDVAALRQAWQAHEGKVRELVERVGEAGLSRVIEYTLLSGQTGASVLWQMVQHVVNHATYHRGQLTTMLRQIGVAPPKSTDLILFYRERGGRPA